MPRIRYTTTRAARIRSGTVPSDCWNACAVPWKLELSVAGEPRSAIAFCTAPVACPKPTPCARLKLIVIAGNWPSRLIDSEPTGTVVQVANVDNGTLSPVAGDLI